MRIYTKITLLLLTAFLTFFMCTPRNYYWLQLFSLVPFLWALNSKSPGNNFLWGWFSGTAMNMFIFYWLIETIQSYTNIPGIIALFLLFLFASWGGIMYGIIAAALAYFQRYNRNWLPCLFAAVAVSTEYLFPQIFPWFQGCNQFHNLALLQLAAYTGVYGISFVVFWSNAVVYQILTSCFSSKKKLAFPWPKLLLLILVLSFLHIGGWLRLQKLHQLKSNSPRLGVAMIQDGLGDRGAMKKYRYHSQFIKRYQYLSERVVRNQKVDMLIWPEGTFGYAPHGLSFNYLRQWARDLGVIFIFGGRSGTKEQLRTGGFAFYPDGSMESNDKLLLVPFGEYNPLAKYFPKISSSIRGMGNLHPGTEYRNFYAKKSDLQLKYTILLCYEAIFSQVVRKRVREGAQFVVNLTKDSWFGTSDCPHQHMMLVALKAVEMGVPIFRSTNTGLTVFIDATGAVDGENNPLFQEFVFYRQVALFSIPTLYRAIGPLLPILCICGIVIYFVLLYIQWKRSIAST